MGKPGGFLTPKAIANRIKAKGLQKLRWYCQMCQKQCRDENGFKCHLTSESHQRQLLLFAENPDEYIDSFSKDFFEGYTELLSRRFGTKRVNCNIVYQEYIADREHTHMNSTQWETLTDFIKWLGKEGHAVVDCTEKGWFVQWIDKDPETIQKQKNVQKKEKMEMDDEDRAAKFIQQQIERAAAQEKEKPVAEFTELKRENEDEKITLSLGLGKVKAPEKPGPSGLKIEGNPFKANHKKDKPEASSSSKNSDLTAPKVGEKRKVSALDEIMKMEEKTKDKVNRKDYWLHQDIVVKVVTKKLGDKFYKKKAVVQEVVDVFGAVVKMLETGVKIKVDQAHLETVIPAIGKSVLIVNGANRGYEAKLESINEKKFSCTVKIAHGPLKGRIVEHVQYEDICKINRGLSN